MYFYISLLIRVNIEDFSTTWNAKIQIEIILRNRTGVNENVTSTQDLSYKVRWNSFELIHIRRCVCVMHSPSHLDQFGYYPALTHSISVYCTATRTPQPNSESNGRHTRGGTISRLTSHNFRGRPVISSLPICRTYYQSSCLCRLSPTSGFWIKRKLLVDGSNK